MKTDVSKPENVNQLIEQTLFYYNNIDILVNAAAIQSPIGLFAETDLNDIVRNIEVNFLGTLLCCKYVLPLMIENKYGKIINFSGGGSLFPRENFSIYGASKTAIIRFSETLAKEVEKYRINVNIIAPGSVDTHMVDEILSIGEKAGEKAINEAKRVRKTGGTGIKPVQELAVFLASPDSRSINGRLISAPWDDWRSLDSEKLRDSSLYTLRRIDGRDFFDKND